MQQQQICRSCGHKDDCRKVYEQLGRTGGPSVACKALLAFAGPIAVFIITLTVSERFLAKMLDCKELQTIIGFLAAMTVTFVLILIIKAIDTRAGKKQAIH